MLARLQTIINASVEDGISALKAMKEQLCPAQEIDYKALMKATGTFFKQATILSRQQRFMMPRGSRQMPVPMEE
jgi:hypothetical protein